MEGFWCYKRTKPWIMRTFFTFHQGPLPAYPWRHRRWRLSGVARLAPKPSTINSPTTNQTAFTRLELLAVFSVLLLMAAVALPLLASTKPRADRVGCINNLRLVGRAEQAWATDHRDQMPWRTDMSEGGTQHDPLQNNSWRNYGVMSNELATPAILACPSDESTKVARTFSSSPTDGFFSLNYQSKAVSYFIGLDTFLTAGLPYVSPAGIAAGLGGDRNLQVDSYNETCSSGVTIAAAVHSMQSRTGWTNAIHGLSGNILMVDGQVRQTSNGRVVESIAPGLDDNGSYHLLMPR